MATEVRQTQMRALEENNGDMNGADKGRTEAAEDGSGETAASGQRRMWFGDFEMVAPAEISQKCNGKWCRNGMIETDTERELWRRYVVARRWRHW